MSKQNILNELKSYSTVMFGTLEQDGTYEFRPMAIAKNIEDKFYFITSYSSGKVSNIKANHKVILTAQSSSSFLAIRGEGEVRKDSDFLESIWSQNFQAWFPNGSSDPDVCLIQFTPTSGEFWDNNIINKAKYIWEVVSSSVTGKKAEIKDAHESF